MNDELPSALLQCAAWLSSLLYLAIGVVAVVRLRATPAGLLIGGGFVLWSLAGVFFRLVRLVVTDTADVDIRTFMLIGTSSSCASMLFALVIAVGFALLPRSLAKLEGAPMKLGPREG